jgi:uncharacterized membrane protein
LDDADPRLSRLVLLCAALGAGLHLVASIRARGLRRSVLLLVLCTWLPATGELLATGPLRLLRHRLRYRLVGVPLAILLGWYAAIHGCLVIARRVAEPTRSGKDATKTVPVLAALVGVSLDLILDPAGLDLGLWEWNSDGTYAAEVAGPNGHVGVPLVNYLGWASLVGGATYLYGSACEDKAEDPLPALLLLPLYLAAVGWAIERRKYRYILLSATFPVALYVALQKG